MVVLSAWQLNSCGALTAYLLKDMQFILMAYGRIIQRVVEQEDMREDKINYRSKLLLKNNKVFTVKIH